MIGKDEGFVFLGFCQNFDQLIAFEKELSLKFKGMDNIKFSKILYSDLLVQANYYLNEMKKKVPSMHHDGFFNCCDWEDISATIFYDPKDAEKLAKFLCNTGTDLDSESFSDEIEDPLSITKYELYSIFHKLKLTTEISILDRIYINVPKKSYSNSEINKNCVNNVLLKELRRLYGEE